MTSANFTIRRMSRIAGVLAAAGLLVLAVGVERSNGASASRHDGFTFKMVRTPGLTCLPHAGGSVKITRGSLNDTMTISVHGLPPRTGFDLFVIQLPNKPFGVAWYQTDVETNRFGRGTATVRGIFNKETFSVSPGGTVAFAPTHQYHLGMWFNSPQKPFNIGCEGAATSPIITPFNGEQHAGIQILNTSNFPDAAGPLSRVRG